ncbi:hypothetical protein NP493_425g05029 [Ridgeia piscesae]|uniref:Uncharacterized protein n=1 Tax=Ridgeia piscesae TaxID=27915 RepID=A0AAD9L157_RIDPI|nr:hypothetical protein NP493_425g05029 [Ridgeia piscesae]
MDEITVETESNCSMEDAMAVVEDVLRRSLGITRDTHAGDSQGDEIDALDVTQLPGYQPVLEGCVAWKAALIEKKNKELVEKEKERLVAVRAEQERWKGIPDWKKRLMMEQEKKKQADMGPQELERQRKEQEKAKLQAMPDWKRNLVTKKCKD